MTFISVERWPVLQLVTTGMVSIGAGSAPGARRDKKKAVRYTTHAITHGWEMFVNDWKKVEQA